MSGRWSAIITAPGTNDLLVKGLNSAVGLAKGLSSATGGTPLINYEFSAGLFYLPSSPKLGNSL